MHKKFQDFSIINALGIKFGLEVKKGQGQPGSIICANLVGPSSPIIHTKSQGHLVLEKKIFKGLLLYMGMAAILVK